MRRYRHPHHIPKHHKLHVYRMIVRIIIPLVFVLLAALAVGALPAIGVSSDNATALGGAALISLSRLAIAYALSLVVGIALALFATMSPTIEGILLPIFDVVESIPVLVFFPIIIAVFINHQFFNAAAITILFLNMLWNIVFSVVGGVKLIPQEIHSAAHVFGLSKTQYITKVIIPAITPSLITGSLLAFAEGWNMLIVAEVLHSFAPASLVIKDLFGIGSILVQSSANGDTKLFLESLTVVITVIVSLNIGLWQPLIRKSEKYRFDA